MYQLENNPVFDQLFDYRLKKRDVFRHSRESAKTVKQNDLFDTQTQPWWDYINDLVWNRDVEEIQSIVESVLAYPQKRYFFLGCHHDRDQSILKYLVCLKNNLDRDLELESRIVYEKLSCLIELLSPEEKWKNRNTTERWRHDSACNCDKGVTMGGGCRRQRLIKASLRRLEELNAEIRERKDRLNVFDGRLDNFQRQKEAYKKWREKMQRKMSKERKERTKFLLTQIDTENICKTKRKKQREMEHQEYLNRMKQITAKRKKLKEELSLKEAAEKEELMMREKDNKQQQIQQQQRRQRHIMFPSILRKTLKTVLTSGETNKKQKTNQLKLPILRKNDVALFEEDDAKTKHSKKKEKIQKSKSNHESTFSEEKHTWENGKNGDFQTEKKQPRYLETDLGKINTIQQIILQRKGVEEGRTKTHNKQTFTITYSLDGVEWLSYDDKYGEALIFEAAPFQISTHSLSEELVTKFIRIYPTGCFAGDEFLDSILQVEFKDVSNTEVSEGKEQKKKKHQKKHGQVKLKPVAHITTPPQTDTLPPIDPPLESVPANEIVLDERSAIYDKLFQDDLKIHLDEELLKYQNHVTSTSRKIMAFKGESVIEEEEEKEEDVEEAKETKETKFRKMVFLANKRRKLKLQLELNRKKNQIKIYKSKKEEIISKREITVNQEDFFSMYCIITDEQQEWYTAIYRDLQEQQDETSREDLTMEDVSDALLIVHKSLVSDNELQYIKTVLDILGVNLDGKISLQVFSLVAAFAEKIISTRELFRYDIANVDYKTLSTCFSKAKQLYTILLREKETVIHVEDLMFELHAAEMNQKILKYILQNQDKTKIDFLDYITYFPLFIHTHDVIVQNPM
ncbi:uncharacterized protein LOC130636255 isoform X2 [Hydractinia symbiolongicarpus]|uniref:uncharacterized protein LOC130636255 isoform X2 n=1 Tax=Hydractinia symbiolongicarpus TaxID=13093 RepID=UPI00254AE8F3|nr:uncharacterized protein LOC130636255 isoform X2 [Hydractinia symbiolongicarpus]